MSDGDKENTLSQDVNKAIDFNVVKQRKKRDLAALLPIVGILLFVTPLISTFNTTSDHVSASVLYIFGIWALLILCSYQLSRILSKSDFSEPLDE